MYSFTWGGEVILQAVLVFSLSSRKCTRLEDITLPGSVTELGDYVFSECSCLIGVTLGNTYKDTTHMFNECTKLTGITITGGEVIDNAFNGM